MRNHNHLLWKIEGCDGFKTGYFKKAGFSIAVTVKRDGVRIIAIVMGSKDRKVRDAKARELIAKGFARVPVRIIAQQRNVEVKAVQKAEESATLSNKEPVIVPASQPIHNFL